MEQLTREAQINRLNQLSKTHPVMPDEFIPWDNKITTEEIYMPQFLFSLDGTGLEKNLTDQQITRLKVLEVSQVMAVYAFSESVGCAIFTELLIKTTPTSPEGKYLVNMMAEELRHQYMFARVVEQLGVTIEPPPFWHRTIVSLFLKTFDKCSKYMIVLAIEQVADVYAKHFRKDPRVYSVIRKTSELHHIEEGRHMAYQKICLDQYLASMGPVKRTITGIWFVLTIWFMRSQYIKRSFFVDIGVADPDHYYKTSVKNYRKLFGEHCLKECVEYSRSIGLMNFVTKFFWNKILKANI